MNREDDPRIPDMSTLWKLWHRDMFDRDSPPFLQSSGADILQGLYELWRYTLKEGIQDNGNASFSRFYLTWGETASTRIEVIVNPFDNRSLKKLRGWVSFMTQPQEAEQTFARQQEEQRIFILKKLARFHYELLQTSKRWKGLPVDWNAESRELLAQVEGMTEPWNEEPLEAKMTLAEEFFALSTEQRQSVHFILCQHALDKWASYMQTEGEIRYVESVVGTQQVVDSDLPFDAYQAARTGFNTENVAKRYLEPIAALQDDDLAFPQSITFAFYAIYNLFKRYANMEEVDDWLIVNQALSSENDSELWNALLANAIQMAKQ